MSQVKAPERGLVVTGAGKIYPGTVALAGVDLEVRPGELVALLGENGAGKSTLAGIIAGVTAPNSGTLTWDGKPYAPSSPAEGLKAGIALIHQEMRLLPELTVAENIVVGNWPKKRGVFDRSAAREIAAEKMSLLGYKGSVDVLVRDLSVAAQQQVEIAKALALDARLLILDEPTAALGAEETTALFETVHNLKAAGVSFIYVSHRLAEIARIADRIVVLRDGKEVAVHERGDVDPAQLVREMVGRPVDRLFPDFPKPGNEVVLKVEGLTAKDKYFQNISFEVRKGEILGIAGIVGAGRTELVRSIAGADKPASGTAQISGKNLPLGDIIGVIQSGLVMVPEDRKNQGVIVASTIQENVVLANQDKVSKAGWISEKLSQGLTEKVIDDLSVKGVPGASVSSLSGGNQQKVVIGKWLARDPKVVILDEPTRGIDVGARAAIYDVIEELCAQGVAVVVVSSDLEEVIGLSHRVLVLSRGQNQGILSRADATPERVIELATR